MSKRSKGERYQLNILDQPETMAQVGELQQLVWPGNEIDVVPTHMLLAAAHNGGLVIGAYAIKTDFAGDPGSPSEDSEWSQRRELPPEAPLVGFVFGFPGLYSTPDGPRPKHCSHMLGVHPEYRDQGIGFTLKRAQWQMVRHQGLDRVTWTYDPLQSRNAHLNISRLGVVCNTYLRDTYGQMRDGLNIGLPSDRFQVDWWINSQRAVQRLSKKPRPKLDLAHFLAAGALILNPSYIGEDNLPRPASQTVLEDLAKPQDGEGVSSIILVEIPADIIALKAADPDLGLEWRIHTRTVFENLFTRGYLVTDFVHLPGTFPRSFYVLSHGESTL